MSKTGERPDQGASWRQFGVLVLDGSVSMTWDLAKNKEGKGFEGRKCEAVATAVSDLFTRIEAGSVASNFTFAIVKFNDYVVEEIAPTPFFELDKKANFDPTSRGTGIGTYIGSGLGRAGEMCEQFLADHQDGLPTSAVILLLTDGECDHPDQTKEIAKTIKQNSQIKIATSFFATLGRTPDGAELLQNICSEPMNRYYKLVYDGENLRKFWEESMN